jgi:hypothetical protein
MRAGVLVVAVVVMVVWGLRLAGRSAQTPSGQPATFAPMAAISGTVKDGTTGRPIPGVIVSLRAGTGPQVTPAIARGMRQLTDALGRFVFRNLPPALGYTIVTNRIGFVDGAYGQSVTFGPSGKINLTSGQWFNQAAILMWKPGAIGGRVIDEHGDPVVGIFVRVLAQQLVAGTMKLLAGPSAKTDDRGEYRVAGLVPARYLVVVPSVQSTVPSSLASSALAPETAPAQALELQLMGFSRPAPRVDAALDLDPSNRLVVGNYPTPPAVNGRPQAYPVTFFPAGSAAASASAIDLGLAEERHGADIALQPVPTVRIAGTLDGPQDQVGGMLLRLMPAGLEELANGSEAATTIAGGDGRFVFLNVPVGTYTIDARRSTTELTFQSGVTNSGLPPPPGGVDRGSQSGDIKSGPPGSGFMTRDGSMPDRYWARTAVTVGAADIADLVVPLHRSIVLSGRMVFEGTTRAIVIASQNTGGRAVSSAAPVVVTATTEAPLRLPVLYAEPANADASLGVLRSDNNADAGVPDAFVMDGLRSGEYVLRMNQGIGYMIKSITIGGADVTFKPIDTSAQRNIADVVVTFTDQISTLTGFVQGDPAALSNAAVIAFPVDRERWARYGFTPVLIQAVPMEAATGYRIQGLPAGEYFLVAVDRSQITAWQDPKFLERAAGVATRVKIGWGDTQSADLKLVRIR